jgi:hypothetical protein
MTIAQGVDVVGKEAVGAALIDRASTSADSITAEEGSRRVKNVTGNEREIPGIDPTEGIRRRTGTVRPGDPGSCQRGREIVIGKLGKGSDI